MRNLMLLSALALALVGGVRGCTNGWTDIDGTCCYFHMESAMDWNSARTLCQDLGGDLAKLSTGTALRQAYEYIKTYTLSGSFWLAGSDATVEGDWIWVTDVTRVDMGTPFWAINTGLLGNSHEPSGGSQENCLALDEERMYFFNDYSCSQNYHPICMQ